MYDSGNRSARGFSAAVVPAIILMIGARCQVEADTLVIPTPLENTDANSESVFPTALNSLGGFRVMQVYDAAPFLTASGGRPLAITQFALRPDAALQTMPGTMDITLKAYMSTTSRSPDGSSPNFLSEVFADNIETSETLILDGLLPLTSAGAPGGGIPGPFDVRKPFVAPYVYDPTAGNLLLDLRIERVESSIIVTDFVRDDPAGAEVARILGISANAPTATTMDPFGPPFARTGLVTQFTWTVVPEPLSFMLCLLTLGGFIAGRNRF